LTRKLKQQQAISSNAVGLCKEAMCNAQWAMGSVGADVTAWEIEEGGGESQRVLKDDVVLVVFCSPRIVHCHFTLHAFISLQSVFVVAFIVC
jgi:hypothetical protein